MTLINSLSEALAPKSLSPAEQAEAQLILARARYIASKKHPYLSEALFATVAVVDMNLPLAAPVRFGSRAMRWSPAAFLALRNQSGSEDAVAHHIAHEMAHWLFETDARARKHVTITPQGGTVACDQGKFWFSACTAINDWLHVSGWPCGVPNPEQFGLPSGQTTEFYYARLPDPPPSEETSDCSSHRDYGRDDDPIKSQAMRAACAQNMTPGQDPHNELLSFVERHRVKFDWTKQLFRDMHGRGQASKHDTASFTRMSRLQGCMPPGVRLMGRRPQPAASIAVILDTSGSIDDGIRARFASVIRQLMSLTSFYLITNDADVADASDVYSWRDIIPMVRGGGGTDFTPAFEHLNALQRNFAGVYILTDGYAFVPLSKPVPYPVTWCIIGDAPAPCNWGNVLRIPTT